MCFSQIYELTYPETGDCRYVGQSNLIAKRYKEHIGAAKRGTRLPVYDWIRKLLSIGSKPGIRVIETCEASEVNQREIYWIAQRRSEGARLMNVSDGGGGRLGYVLSEESREKLSAAHRGKKFSASHIANMAASRMGKKRSAGSIAKQTAKRVGVKLTPEQSAARKEKFKNKVMLRPDMVGPANHKSRLTQEQAESVKTLHSAGLSRKNLRERFSVSKTVISRILRNQGYRTDTVSAVISPVRRVRQSNATASMTDAQVSEIRRLFAAGESRRQISTSTSVGYDRVCRVIKGDTSRHLLADV